MITLKNIIKSYADDTGTTTILKDISLQIMGGERVAIIGPSGSGKSTLLSIMSGLDNPTSGSVLVDNIDIGKLSDKELARFRNEKISMIFQSFELVQFFTAYENIMLPLAIRNQQDKSKIQEIIKNVDLAHRQDNFPTTLSGGEQQRVAIARALASGSEIIFADEPTGNLDSTTGKKILDLLLTTIRENKKTFIIITHDMSIAKQMDTVYEMRDGQLFNITHRQ